MCDYSLHHVANRPAKIEDSRICNLCLVEPSTRYLQ
jgi:hypothetical protein